MNGAACQTALGPKTSPHTLVETLTTKPIMTVSSRLRSFLSLLLLCLFGAAAAACEAQERVTSVQQVQKSVTSIPRTASTVNNRRPSPQGENLSKTIEGEIELLPPNQLPLRQLLLHTGGATPEDKLPWIVALHGLGDSPSNFSRILQSFRARTHLFVLQAPLPRGSRGFDWLGVSVHQGEKKVAQALAQAAKLIAAQLKTLESLKHTQGRAIVTGFSQGGMLSFTLAALHPKLLFGAVPVAGWLPATLVPQTHVAPGKPRIVALHGEADRIIPLAPTQRSVGALSAAGYDIRLRTYPNVEHSIPQQVHRDMLVELTTLVKASSEK